MSQKTLSHDLENRKYRGLLYKERYNNTNKDDSSKHQKREILRDLTQKYARNSTTIKTNERKFKSFREKTYERGLLSYSTNERTENNVQPILDTNKFFTDLSKEKTVMNNSSDILRKTYSKIEVENYFEKIYGKNGIKGMTVYFYDLESIKDKKSSIPEWLLKDNSEELFEAELPPQDITVYNLWFFRRKNEGSPDFVQKGTMPISNTDISSHLENIYNNPREGKQSSTNRNGSKMIRLVLDELRKVNNYMLYMGSEIRYPNNVFEKTPKLVEKLERALERIRFYKKYEGSINMDNDEKAIKYAKELLDVAWMNFNVRTRDESKNYVIFRKVWIEVNKIFEEIIEKYFNRNKKYFLRS